MTADPTTTEPTEPTTETTEPTPTLDAPTVAVTEKKVASEQTFADLGVHADICAALDAAGITSPFPIQAMAIPIAVAGTDMIGQARTGTGKTLAFGVSTLQRIEVGTGSIKPQALVVAPTRELASQVSKDLQVAASVMGARILTVYGGVGYEPQLDALAAGVDVVVGTPGRLLDLANRRALDLSEIAVLVLDEADEMLDLGFLPDVERLLAKTPASRQTLLFSATMPSAIMSLARTHLTQPVNIRAESADESTTVPNTTQFVYQAHDLDKPEVVARILQAEGRDRCMIFCRTKRAAQRLADDLAERGFAAAPIHGDLRQEAREKALAKFRNGTVDVLVCTDVAARGIDVGGVTHVINHECPDDDKTYVHRIGRTGRAGNTGVAVTLVDWADVTRWKVINKALDLDFFEPVETYSSSEHLFTDLEIAPGTKGRLVDPAPSEPAGSRGGAGSRAPRERAERPRRERGGRRRTRNGVDVSTPAGEATETEQPRVQDSSSGEGSSTPRSRRRRRGGRSSAQAAGTQASDTQAADTQASDTE